MRCSSLSKSSETVFVAGQVLIGRSPHCVEAWLNTWLN